MQFDLKTVTLADSIVWDSEELDVTDGKVTADSAGVYELIAMNGDIEKTVYLVVKEPEDTEYVLYYNGFDSDADKDSLSCIETNGSGANYSVSDGRLKLNAAGAGGNVVRVLFPQWLGDFANYSITASGTITQKANDSRWTSIMHRVQNNNDPYYQLCIRANANATNGVELAYKTTEGSWAYHGKAGFTSALSPSSLYEFNITVKESSLSAGINGEELLSSDAAGDLTCGRVGLQASGCLAEYDYVKITAVFPLVSTLGLSNVDVKEVSSNITSAPTVIDVVESKEDLEALTDSKAAVAMMTVNSDGFIVTPQGKLICDLAEAMIMIDGKVIPAFRFSEEVTYADTVLLTARIRVKEFMVAAYDPLVLQHVRKFRPEAIAILDWSESDRTDLITMRSTANAGGARICLLPADLATHVNTELLNSLAMSVWYMAESNSKVELVNLITAGANGIVTSDEKQLCDLLGSDIFASNTIIRPVNVIGHRGMPAVAPENTIVGSQLAAKYGASIIENDIYITTDGVLVVMHDGTIDRTTNGTGRVEDYSYSQLCQLCVDDAPDGGTNLNTVTSTQPIPTLEEYFETFKDTDTFLFIEIKSTNADRLVPALRQLIEEYDYFGQCGVICFNADMLKAVKKTIPELSVGYLYSESNFDTVYANTNSLTSTFNPSHTAISQELIRKLGHRGITTWPWTVNNSNDFDKLFLWGVGGITTNYANFAADYVKRITPEQRELTLNVGDRVALKIIAEKYSSAYADYSNDTYVTTNAEMVLLEGNDSISFNGTNVTATKAGDATVIFRMSYRLNNGTTVYVYTQPVTIHVN